MKRIAHTFVFVAVVLLASCSSQKEAAEADNHGMKQKTFSDEQIKSDAMALAQIICESEVATYQALQQKNNRKMNVDAEEKARLRQQMEGKFNVRYLQIEDLKVKFNKELEKAQKQLTTCQKWEEIQAMEEAKAKMEEKEQ